MPSSSPTPRLEASSDAPARAKPRSNADVFFALVAHPTVQVVRFATKVLLAWFLVVEHFGEVMLAGLLINLVAPLSVLGLEKAFVWMPRPDRSLWRRMRAIHHATGLLGGALVVAAGAGLGAWLDYPLLPSLCLALGPWVWFHNQASLSMARLVRARDYRSLFWVDLVSIATFSAATLVLASFGAGVWCVVAGWYGHVGTRALLTPLFARRHPLPAEKSASTGEALRYGAHLAGADFLGFAAERADCLVVGLWIGRAAFGLYDWALHLSHFLVQYLVSLAERVLFPMLARARNQGRFKERYQDALRLTFTYALPAHVALAVAGPSVVVAFFPERWHESESLVAILALSAGAMAFETVGLTALKASGESRTVAQLSALRVALLVVALSLGLALGTLFVAAGIALARALSACATNLAVRRRLGLALTDRDCGTHRAALAFSLWSLSLCAWDRLILTQVELAPLATLAAELSASLLLWVIVRVLSDRQAFGRELRDLRGRLGAAGLGS